MDEQRQREIAATVDALNRHIREHEISDFRIKGLEGETLSLVGSFDLSYYYDIEIVMTGVSWLNLPCYFWTWPSPSPFPSAFPPRIPLYSASWTAVPVNWER